MHSIPSTHPFLIFAFSATAMIGACAAVFAVPDRTPVFDYRIVRSFPHDTSASTQGLAFDGGRFVEGTGIRGRTSVRIVSPKTGQVLKIHRLSYRYFGEGVTVVGDKVIQLTWKSRRGFVYRRDDLTPLREFSYRHEGWGLTFDGRRLVMSDGTSYLRFFDTTTFREIGRLSVFDECGQVDQLNELEYVDGEIYANVWNSERIARISPRTGRVLGWINLSGLLPRADIGPDTGVLNGIAYDAREGRLFVTGKRWPKIYQIELVPAGDVDQQAVAFSPVD